MPPHRPADERFWEKVNKNGPIPAHRPELGPCWIWLARIEPNGYGKFHLEGTRTVWAHHFTMPDCPVGFERDHLCRNRVCVRRSHMEFVKRKVNNARGNSPTAINLRKTHCIRGHRITARGKGTKCRACHLAYMREYHRAHPATSSRA